MFLNPCRIFVLVFIFLFPRESEMLAPIFIEEPPETVEVMQNDSVTLTWRYNLNGENNMTLFHLKMPYKIIVERVRSNQATVQPEYNSRVTANVTDTSASITFLQVDRSAAYGFDITNSRGNIAVMQLLIIALNYKSVGCYQDNANRAIPTLEGTDDILDGHYSSRNNAIAKCATAAQKRGFTVFALQNGGWCAASATAEKTFDKYGKSGACQNDGEGGSMANNVYVIGAKPENVQLTMAIYGNVTNKTCQNDVVNFTCSAAVANYPPVSYQLIKDEVAQESSSSGMWNETMSSRGVFIYKCVANNTRGTTTSENVSITVNVPPTIQVIQDQVITEGGNVSLSCQASAILTPTVYWIRVGSGQPTNGSVLQFTNISRSVDGQYRCEASNECGNANQTANIDIQYKPDNIQLVTTAAANKTCQNDVVNFTCSAGAANPPVTSYQLIENEVVQGKDGEGSFEQTLSNGGVFIYKCAANNSVGTTNSASVSIIVNVPPSIQPIQNGVVTEGDNVTLFCNASGTTPPAVSWVKVIGGQRNDGNMWQFTNINRNETGEYRCESSNQCGNASKYTSIDVQYPPAITHISDSHILMNGTILTLTCTADGNPAATITWNKVSDNSVVTFPLTVTDTQDEGVYRCTASNGVGSSVTRDVSVAVHFAASIVPLEKTKIVKKGDNVTLHCSASGNPVPNVSWIHNESSIRHNDETWVIADIGDSDLGVYRCDASNMYRNASDTIAIFYEGGRCETACSNGQNCRKIGELFSCLCNRGKKGPNCEQTETLKRAHLIQCTLIKPYKPVYGNLQNRETKTLLKEIEDACYQEYHGFDGYKNSSVSKLSEGSVIADVELTFNDPVSESEIREFTQKITEDGMLGQLNVSEVRVGPPEPASTEKQDCNAFFEGQDCKKAKPAMIALCVVAGIVVLALIIAITACSLYKKKSGGKAFSNVAFPLRREIEGNVTTGEKNLGGNNNGNANTGYEYEKQSSTTMVTFNPAQASDIAFNDSDVSKM